MFNYLYAIILGAGILTGIGPTYFVMHANHKIETQALELTLSKQQTVSVQTALNKLRDMIGTANIASAGYQQALANLNSQYTDINRKLADVSKKSPLPLDCRPTSDRLSILRSAVDSANSASSTP